MRNSIALALAAIVLAQGPARAANWPAPQPPALAHAPGYVDIPDVAVKRDPRRTYKAIFNAVAGPKDHAKQLAALERVGLQINGLMLAHVPADHIRFVMILHGPSVEALYTDAEYRAKFGTPNPNLPLVEELLEAGVQIFVCGQYMAKSDTPRSALITQAQVAEAATLVMITYADDGYALIDE